MRIHIFTIPTETTLLMKEKVMPRYRGYIEAETFDPDQCWHLCNWSCWAEKKPENLHANIGAHGSGIIFKPEGSAEYHMALAIGWRVYRSLEAIANDVRKRGYYAMLPGEI